MLTYFVHVFPSGWKREGPKVWLGGKPEELYDLPDLRRAIRPYADLSPELAHELYGDRDEGR